MNLTIPWGLIITAALGIAIINNPNKFSKTKRISKELGFSLNEKCTHIKITNNDKVYDRNFCSFLNKRFTKAHPAELMYDDLIKEIGGNLKYCRNPWLEDEPYNQLNGFIGDFFGKQILLYKNLDHDFNCEYIGEIDDETKKEILEIQDWSGLNKQTRDIIINELYSCGEYPCSSERDI